MSQTYGDKADVYFANARTQIEPLLPARAARVIEIGCSAGGTVRWLKDAGRIDRAWGMELFESAAREARPHFEEIIVGDAEALIETAYPGQQFDLMLCLDVLEHMIDPWRFLSRAQRLLAPAGQLIISVPNIRCVRALWPLLMRGEWQYTDEGILDRTHLRFFTRASALALATGAGMTIDGCLGLVRPHSRLARINRWTFGLFEEFASTQYLVSATRATGPRV